MPRRLVVLPPEKPVIERRSLLIASASCALASACGGGEPSAPGFTRDPATRGANDDAATGLPSAACTTVVGVASDFALGDAVYVAAEQVFVLRDTGGLYAVSAICPHQGCTIDFYADVDSFRCPCHGSTFDANGARTGGPAPRSLDHFALCVSGGGGVAIDRDTVVSTETRLVV
jgi:Rieske Fe-S protein